MGDNPLNWYGDVEKQQQEILCGLGMIPFLIHLLRSVFQVFTIDVILDDSGKSPPQLNLMVRGVFHQFFFSTKNCFVKHLFEHPTITSLYNTCSSSCKTSRQTKFHK